MGEVADRERPFKPHVLLCHADAIGSKFKCPACKRTLHHEAFVSVVFYRQGAASWHYLHPLCKLCLKERRSRFKKHPLFTTEAFRYWNRQYQSMRAGARGRGRCILVSVDIDDLLGLYLQQGGRCALTGVKLSVGKKHGLLKDPTSASVDRIDSAGHYTYENVAIVCARVNVMKGDLTHQEFIEWCQLIIRHQAAKEDEITAALP